MVEGFPMILAGKHAHLCLCVSVLVLIWLPTNFRIAWAGHLELFQQASDGVLYNVYSTVVHTAGRSSAGEAFANRSCEL